jgi:RNA polymerase sigma-70 factor (ECF subfamily)
VRDSSEQTRRIAQLFDHQAARLFTYARRHADHSRAEDLVASAFEVALRRAQDVPTDDGEAFAWLVGTVRKLAANHRRRARVAERHWAEQVRALWHLTTASSLDDAVAERDTALAALAALRPRDREAVLLVAWDGLTADQAAQVTGCSANAFTVRLHRARRRLEEAQTAGTPLRIVTEGTR